MSAFETLSRGLLLPWKGSLFIHLSLPEEVLILSCGNFVSNVVSTVHSLFNELFMRLARQLIYRDSVLFILIPLYWNWLQLECDHREFSVNSS